MNSFFVKFYGGADTRNIAKYFCLLAIIGNFAVSVENSKTQLTVSLEHGFNNRFEADHKVAPTTFLVSDHKTRKEQIDVSGLGISTLNPGKNVKVKGNFKTVGVPLSVGKSRKVFLTAEIVYQSVHGSKGVAGILSEEEGV